MGRRGGGRAGPGSARSASAAPTRTSCWRRRRRCRRPGRPGRRGRRSCCSSRARTPPRSHARPIGLADHLPTDPEPDLADVAVHPAARPPGASGTGRAVVAATTCRTRSPRCGDRKRLVTGQAAARPPRVGVPVLRPGLAVRRDGRASCTPSEPVLPAAVDECADILHPELGPRPARRCSFARDPATAADASWPAPRSPSRRCSPSSTRWPRSGGRGASSPPRCSGTASASTSRRRWPGCSRWRTRCGWSPPGAG